VGPDDDTGKDEAKYSSKTKALKQDDA
jgi:hypothetical protein